MAQHLDIRQEVIAPYRLNRPRDRFSEKLTLGGNERRDKVYRCDNCTCSDNIDIRNCKQFKFKSNFEV